MFTLLFLVVVTFVLIFVAIRINGIYLVSLDKKEKHQIKVAVEEVENMDKIEEVDEDDFDEAKEFCIKTKKASISSLQTEFSWGYNKAAAIMGSLEHEGIIGPAELSKRYRAVLTKKETK